jgi:hypothetical protein
MRPEWVVFPSLPVSALAASNRPFALLNESPLGLDTFLSKSLIWFLAEVSAFVSPLDDPLMLTKRFPTFAI